MFLYRTIPPKVTQGAATDCSALFEHAFEPIVVEYGTEATGLGSLHGNRNIFAFIERPLLFHKDALHQVHLSTKTGELHIACSGDSIFGMHRMSSRDPSPSAHCYFCVGIANSLGAQT